MAIDYKLIGKRIKEHRKKKSMTQEVLAEKADVTVGYISQIERGICKVNLDTISVIANILECELTDLISGSSTLQSSYLQDEIYSKLKLCSEKQKKMVLEFISMLIKYGE